MNILMVSAENDALPGGKVGGIGDVVRDIPAALADAGQQVCVVTPGYGAFSRLPGATSLARLSVSFRGEQQFVELFQVPGNNPHRGVTQYVLEHPLFAVGGVGQIYCNDDASRPFATDANKFALFSCAVAAAIVGDHFGQLDVLHLHDWHTALVAVLRAFDPGFKSLQSLHTVYTIHNIALQGVRPFAGDESSLQAWFPALQYDASSIHDPRAANCINPMRAGINFADELHVVSSTYAREVVLPSNAAEGFFGGEGLEQDLRSASAQNRLHGILNGCDYSEPLPARLPLAELLDRCDYELVKLIGARPVVSSTHAVASRRIERWLRKLEHSAGINSQPVLVTSIGRITGQKILLLREPLADGRPALEHLLDTLGEHGLLILLGSGDAELQRFLATVAAVHDNFIYLQGYAEALAQDLYSSGDLFLMPSSFEPCGISQMLAMRAGQPCLVHSVGGLRDTVQDGKNGFAFAGDNLQHQAQQMVDRFAGVLQLKQKKPAAWQKIASAAAAARFAWGDAAAAYIEQLYRGRA